MRAIKTIMMGLWISAATLGAMHGVSWWKAVAGSTVTEDGVLFRNFDTETLSIPVFSGGRVTGYAILRLEGAAEAEFLDTANPPMEIAGHHAAYKTFQALAGAIDPSKPKSVNLGLIAEQFTLALESLARRPVARDVVVTQFEFLQRQRTANGS